MPKFLFCFGDLKLADLLCTGARGTTIFSFISGKDLIGKRVRTSFSIVKTSLFWSGAAKDMALPPLPALPVRPARCRYVAISFGGSNYITRSI